MFGKGNVRDICIRYECVYLYCLVLIWLRSVCFQSVSVTCRKEPLPITPLYKRSMIIAVVKHVAICPSFVSYAVIVLFVSSCKLSIPLLQSPFLDVQSPRSSIGKDVDANSHRTTPHSRNRHSSSCYSCLLLSLQCTSPLSLSFFLLSPSLCMISFSFTLQIIHHPYGV